jgi:hypothetical protein
VSNWGRPINRLNTQGKEVIKIGPFVVTHMALGSSRVPREVDLSQEQKPTKSRDFARVLGRYLSETAEQERGVVVAEETASEEVSELPEDEAHPVFILAPVIPFHGNMDASGEGNGMKQVQSHPGLTEERMFPEQLASPLPVPANVEPNQVALEAHIPESTFHGSLLDQLESLTHLQPELKSGQERVHTGTTPLEFSAVQDAVAPDTQGQGMKMDGLTRSHNLFVPERVGVVVGDWEGIQPKVRTRPGDSSEQAVGQVLNHTVEVEVSEQVLPEVVTVRHALEPNPQALPKLTNEEPTGTGHETPAVQVDFMPDSAAWEDSNARMGPEPTGTTDTPFAATEFQDRPEPQDHIVEGQETIVTGPRESHEEVTMLQRGKSRNTVPTSESTPTEGSRSLTGDLAVPGDVQVLDSLVETPEADPQVRAVLDFQDRENLFPKLVQTMETLVLEERSEVRIQLKPDHLGEMKIKLSMERGIVMAEFFVQDHTVREVIASQLPQLQTALQEQGTVMGNVSVSVGLGNKGTEEEGQPKPRHAGKQSPGSFQKATSIGEKAYLGRNIWNQVDLRV